MSKGDRVRYARHAWILIAAATASGLAAPAALAQTPWQTETKPPVESPPAPLTVAPSSNTTIVPRSSDAKPTLAPASGQGQVSLLAVLTEDGQTIEQGLVWRVFRDKLGLDGKPPLVSTHREASPQLKLDAGDYVINVAFGRANLTRKIAVTPDRALQERFVLNAGGLRLTLVFASGEPMGDRNLTFEVYSDERDQSGQRKLLMSSVRPGVIVRLNAGIYNVVSTYGDANAVARADVAVEAGKVSEVTLAHSAAKVTFKLVTRPGGDAIADTQWLVSTAQGETIKESVGALPTHILAPGSYTVSARNAGLVFQREFTIRAGQTAQVEVVRR